MRGIKRDTYVHLAETYDPNHVMTTAEARRCHARVVKTERVGLKKYARLTDCTPEMLAAMQRKMTRSLTTTMCSTNYGADLS